MRWLFIITMTLLALFSTITIVDAKENTANAVKAVKPLNNTQKPPQATEKIIIDKSKHRLYLYRNHHLLHSFTVMLGHHHGPKHQDGDLKTPEGTYHITYHKPHSTYFKALGVSYPNSADRKRANHLHVKPGDEIEIHGMPKGTYWKNRLHGVDWTAGCIAVSNAAMKILYQSVPNGTMIVIKP